MAHLLFLSHAGADTERAVKLAAAIEASTEAGDAGLEIRVDKRADGADRLDRVPWRSTVPQPRLWRMSLP